MKYHIIIPSRYGSTRLAAKALVDIEGKPMVQRVYERALRCHAASVTVATDDARIEAVIKGIGGNVCITDPAHRNGTERLAEAAQLLGLGENDIVVNVQGDEPLFPVEAIPILVAPLQQNPKTMASTLCVPIQDESQIHNPNIAKVVLDKEGYALYFSRAPIPWHREVGRDAGGWSCYRHLGLYAYRVSTLLKYCEWGPSALEEKEGLEQLRILWNGERMKVELFSEIPAPSVDVQSDLDAIRVLFRKQAEMEAM